MTGGGNIGLSASGSRKFSHPVIASKFSGGAMSAKRRLSAVVGRRLSTSISWKSLGQSSVMSSSLSMSVAAAHAVVGDEAKALVARYVTARFRRSGILGHRRLEGLRRMRSVVNMTAANCNAGGGQSREIFAAVDRLGQTLESRHPKLYASVCRQICRTLTSEEAATDVLESIARELLSEAVAAQTLTWGRVVSLFAVTGALSVDCVIQGHVDYVPAVIETFGSFVERELASWILQQGGWYSVVTLVSPCQSTMLSYSSIQATTIVCVLLGILVCTIVLILLQ